MRKKIVKRMCFNAIFASISIILYVIGPKFPLPFLFPGFLDVQFSMLPILIVTFMLGPIDGLIVAFVRFGIKMIFGSSTFGIGETSDLLLSIVVILLLHLVDKLLTKKDNITVKQKFGFRLCTIIISWVIGSLCSNAFCIPMYCITLVGGADTVRGMMPNFGFINENNWILYYFTLAVIPFNIMLSSVVGTLTLLVDKHLLNFYNRI